MADLEHIQNCLQSKRVKWIIAYCLLEGWAAIDRGSSSASKPLTPNLSECKLIHNDTQWSHSCNEMFWFPAQIAEHIPHRAVPPYTSITCNSAERHTELNIFYLIPKLDWAITQYFCSHVFSSVELPFWANSLNIFQSKIWPLLMSQIRDISLGFLAESRGAILWQYTRYSCIF